MIAIAVAMGLVVGGVVAWLVLRDRLVAPLRSENAVLVERLAAKDKTISDMEANAKAQGERLNGLQQEADTLRKMEAELRTTIEKEREASAEKLAVLEDAKTKLLDAFKALSADALKSNNESFVTQAKAVFETFKTEAKGDLEKRQEAIAQMVKPIGESLKSFDTKVQEIEKARTGAYASITQQVKALQDSQVHLRAETSNLVKALRAPHVRGRWGEIQLKRVVELAGMLPYCDFMEQQSVGTENGNLRPDMVVRLPNGKSIVIDAKTPLTAYLEAVEAPDDEQRRGKLALHAQQVRSHIDKLSKKSYWERLEPAPEFVVLFLPGETFFSAALEADPTLIERGVEQRVILATPTTLIALLKAVAYGWRQEELAKNAQQVCQLGKELYDRVNTLAEHLSSLGGSLESAVKRYNQCVGTYESRVLVSARRFQELKAVSDAKPIDELTPVEIEARQLRIGNGKDA